MNGLGEGLAALAFWGFIASVVVAGIWYGLRERQAQYDTLSRMIESGQSIDEDVVEKILGGGKRLDIGLRIAGLIVIFVAPGLAVLAWFISRLSEPWLMPLLGAAALVGFVGIGLLVAAGFAARTHQEDSATNRMI